MVKNLSANAVDASSIPWPGRCPEKGIWQPLKYSCLGNPKDRGAWLAIVRGVTKELDTI